MRTSSIFAARRPDGVADLIRQYPPATVVSARGAEIEATPLPLMVELDESGGVCTLVGHFSRANPHVEMLRDNARALVTFLGAHGYISPSWLTDRKQAPTWNFATVHFVVD